MGRELRRKQAKKEGKSLEKQELIDKSPIRKFIIIICVLITLISTIYIVTALFLTKELDWFSKDKKENAEQTEKSSNSILASALFKQSEESYYVYFYDFNEEKNAITDTINSKWANKKFYKVDTSSAMNAKYVSDKGNKMAKTLSELKVVSPTLIKISNETIVEYYENNEILNFLQLQD